MFVLSFSKLPLLLIFGKVEAEKIEIKDSWYIFKIHNNLEVLIQSSPTTIGRQEVYPIFYLHIKSKIEMSSDLESGKRLAQFSFSVLFDLVSKKSKFHESQA